MELVHESKPALLRELRLGDWGYALVWLLGCLYTLDKFGAGMNVYSKGILCAASLGFIALGWFWKPFRLMCVITAVLSLFAIYEYHGQIASAEQELWLKYLLGSQTAIMWMSFLFVLATLIYWVALLGRSEFAGKFASVLTWCAVVMGLVGMLTRWYVSYLMGPDIGHIPISNLYEVFILFSFMTALFYLYYEDRYESYQMGAFVLLVIAAAIGFLLWYTFDRHANGIEPLVPALQSYWMKIHVPANFVGYGSFSLSAMLGVAYLLKSKGILADRLPDLVLLDDVMYKSIAIGFLFFTIATILGALWAAQAWGGYWSWDPKETWALIVWLNYAAWLHMRLVKGVRGPILAWWSIGGLMVTTFAFLGVNMFLSGLHSYGKL
ncbi:MAG TPA: c-type cytochrome biogenesis protein CcsB [Burkholderiales bacterium]|nr:c-type cytochrome biogenesis protein CcsB [Burkholderiales bacterium]